MRQRPRNGIAFVYPVLAYFAVCLLMDFFVMPFLPLDAVKRQGVTSLAAGTVVYLLFVRSRAGQQEKNCFVRPLCRQTGAGMAAAVLLLGGASVSLNNLICFVNLARVSKSYQQVEQAFYSSSVGWELLVLGILTPLVEEIVYRFAVYMQLRTDFGVRAAIIGSAVVFGAMHMNLVQALYAGVLGVLLALLMEYYQDVRVPMCGHIAANVLSILRSETSLFAWLRQGEPLFWAATLLFFCSSVFLAIFYVQRIRQEQTAVW